MKLRLLIVGLLLLLVGCQNKGSYDSPHCIESFFNKFIELDAYKEVVPYFETYENIPKLIEFSRRYRGSSRNHDFIIVAKMKTILETINIDTLIKSVEEVHELSREGSYSKLVAEKLLKKPEIILKEVYRLLSILIIDINEQLKRYETVKEKTLLSEYNDSYLSIISDMHFYNLDSFEKSNFSNNFNIIAGDFVNNLFHRNYTRINNKTNIMGIGVLGNHDVYLQTNPTKDLKYEIDTNFKKSITMLNSMFPNVNILNDEIVYKDGYAIIGMTLVYDVHQGKKKFFANEFWGAEFKDDDYINRAKNLLDQVDKDMPIVFISHSPFKEYSVSNNKEIGVPTNNLFKNYPNVKVYIHGHGHGRPQKKIIGGVVCISNPINIAQTYSEFSYAEDEFMSILGNKPKKELTSD